MTIEDEVKAQREKEQQERIIHAQQRAQALSTLMLGERIAIDGDTEIMAVPNGWIFYRTHKAGITGTFVPGMGPPPGGDKKPEFIL